MRKTALWLLLLPSIVLPFRGLTTVLDVEFLYMKRANDASRNCLSVVDDASGVLGSGGCASGNCKFTSKDVIHGQGYEPGLRVGLSFLPNNQETWEISYEGLLSWESHKSAECSSTLEYPFRNSNPTVDWLDNERMESDIRADFFDVECSYWRHITPQRTQHFSVSGMIGLRYFQFWETFNLKSHVMGDSSDYNVEAWNYMTGIQAGGQYESMLFPHFLWTLSIKLGGLMNYAEQKTRWDDDNNTDVLVDENPHKLRAAFMGELGINFIIECSKKIDFVFGYQAIFLNSIAQSTRQLYYDGDTLGKNRVNTKSHLLLYGGNAGFQLAF